MSAMSQIMDATYCIGGDMDFGRMFDQYLHKGGESFDLSLTVPDSNHTAYMADQQPAYGSFGSEETYSDLQGMGTTLPQQEGDAASSAPHTHAHHTQAMYSHQMAVASSMGAPNPQFPPQNLYIPPISQNSMDPAQTSGYMVHPGCGPPAPIYTSASPGMPTGVPQGPHMMGGAVGMMGYYPRQPMARNGGSPNSGGSPSPGSEDSDDSTPLAQMARAKRPSSESVEGPARGKKPKVSKKSKKKKDPNEPQKPVSAYALFFRDTQAAIKGSNPNASFGEVSKIVASMWDSLDADHKSVYKKKTEAAKKEYLKALAAYRASLVSKGGEGEGGFGGPQGYGQFAPGFGYPPTTSTPVHPQVQSPAQMSPLAKKSPLLSSLMADTPPPMMNPPMSQPMPPSGPPMMPHGSMPPMSAASMVPQAQQGPQAGHQPPTPQPHLTPMTNVPSTSPYMTQQAPGSLTSPGGASSPGGGPQQQPQQPQQQQPQQQQPSPQQQQVATQQQQQQQQQAVAVATAGFGSQFPPSRPRSLSPNPPLEPQGVYFPGGAPGGGAYNPWGRGMFDQGFTSPSFFTDLLPPTTQQAPGPKFPPMYEPLSGSMMGGTAPSAASMGAGDKTTALNEGVMSVYPASQYQHLLVAN
uniref:HMG box domain-containing protein n=1 Tax=Scylla olivacea TaxID=85551 RepID=A0A0P4WHI7_SCYOL